MDRKESTGTEDADVKFTVTVSLLVIAFAFVGLALVGLMAVDTGDEATEEANRSRVETGYEIGQYIDSIDRPWGALPRRLASGGSDSTWRNGYFVDDFGERSGTSAYSATLAPVKKMDFPYHDVTGKVMASCQSTWLRFSESPNLTGGDIRDGYEVFMLSVRIDGERNRWRATQRWGSKDISLPRDARTILASARKIDVVLPWYGGSAMFSWDLDGSAIAIEKTCD